MTILEKIQRRKDVERQKQRQRQRQFHEQHQSQQQQQTRNRIRSSRSTSTALTSVSLLKRPLLTSSKRYQQYNFCSTTAITMTKSNYNNNNNNNNSTTGGGTSSSNTKTNSVTNNDTSSCEQLNKVTISEMTFIILQLEVQRLVEDYKSNNRSLTILILTNSLIGNRHLQQSHSQSTSLLSSLLTSKSLPSFNSLTSSSSSSSSSTTPTSNVFTKALSFGSYRNSSRHTTANNNNNTTSTTTEQTSIKLKYEWMNIMTSLQSISVTNHQYSINYIISNYNDAMTILSHVLIFPSNDNNNNNNDDEVDSNSTSDISNYLQRLQAITLTETIKPIIAAAGTCTNSNSNSNSVLLPSHHKWQQIIATATASSTKKATAKHQSATTSTGSDEEPELLTDTTGTTTKTTTIFDDAYTDYTKELYTKRDEKYRAKYKIHDDDFDNNVNETAEEFLAKQRLKKLLRPLTNDEYQLIHTIWSSNDNNVNKIIAQVGTDTLSLRSFQTLQTGQWLNDEVIHYFLIMLQKRDELLCSTSTSTTTSSTNDTNKPILRKRCHFFKSFFITKLINDGHATKNGLYDYKQVKRWSKHVPGSDIFNLYRIIIPINQGQVHWTCICINIQDCTIQFYDSLGSSGTNYLQYIFQYIQDEHIDKKKVPLPNINDWKLISCTNTTPRQLNGFDCGVFTCMFADFLSIDCPLLFGQEHVSVCRQRIALSILQGKALM